METKKIVKKAGRLGIIVLFGSLAIGYIICFLGLIFLFICCIS